MVAQWGTASRALGVLLVGCAATLAASCTPAPHASQPAASPADLPAISPLEEALGGNYMAPLQSTDEYQAHLDEIEQAIARCMRAEGFDYTAWPDSKRLVNWDAGTQQEQLEFAQRYGYGLFHDVPADPGAPTQPADPNLAAQQQMTPAEQMAYNAALGDGNGASDWTAPNGAVIARPDFEATGCRTQGEREVLDGMTGRFWESPYYQLLWEEWAAVASSIQSSSQMTALNSAWSACMADEGFPGATTPSDPWDYVRGEVAAQHMDDDSAAQFEIDVAVADLSCKQSTNYVGGRTAISYNYQREFVASHQAEIQGFVADMADMH